MTQETTEHLAEKFMQKVLSPLVKFKFQRTLRDCRLLSNGQSRQMKTIERQWRSGRATSMSDTVKWRK